MSETWFFLISYGLGFISGLIFIAYLNYEDEDEDDGWGGVC